jgi:hypothetical protein
MMTILKKTTICPDQDPIIVLNQKILKMVVISNNPNLVKAADDLAQVPPTSVDRKVIWCKNPNSCDLKKMIADLPDNLDGIQAFSLSTKNKIADTIKQWTFGDYVRIDSAYTDAGLPQYN